MEARTVVLVEGESDRCALETLARRIGRELSADGVGIAAMGGVTNLPRHLAQLGPDRRDIKLACLCDAAEEAWVRRALARTGFSDAGCFVCVDDLEDELIRALGPAVVEDVIERQGDLRSLRKLQNQPAHRRSAPECQLHRFLGTHSGRKLQYARALVHALDLDRLPRPLTQVLAFA